MQINTSEYVSMYIRYSFSIDFFLILYYFFDKIWNRRLSKFVGLNGDSVIARYLSRGNGIKEGRARRRRPGASCSDDLFLDRVSANIAPLESSFLHFIFRDIFFSVFILKFLSLCFTIRAALQRIFFSAKQRDIRFSAVAPLSRPPSSLTALGPRVRVSSAVRETR